MTVATAPAVTFCFVLIDQTGGAAGTRPDLGPFLPKLRDSLDESLNQNFAPFHGGKYAFRVASSPTDRQPGEVAINIRHQQAGDPQGALAWHQVTGGVPDIEVNLDTTSGLTGDSDGLDVVADHEVKETAADPGANLLADNGNGKSSARESCDRIEDTFYSTSNGLHASNFLTPAAWIVGANAPYDYMEELPSQLDANNNVTMTPGGYDIEATTPTDEADVTPADRVASKSVRAASNVNVRTVSRAPIDGLRLRRKQDPYSRTSRRGVELVEQI